jgi:outer membrane protein assembly factor BamB
MPLMSVLSDAALAENWPGWRGPRGDGTSNEKNVPVKWSDTQNIIWKTPVPGKGHASPIIWERHIFIVTAIQEKKQRTLLCLNRKDGKILWQRVVLEAPLERINRLNSYASSTPATDGEKVYVSFLDVDKMFVAAYDFDGNNIWEVRPDGHGNVTDTHVLWQKDKDCSYVPSPIVFGQYFLIVSDTGIATCFEAKTGKSLWRQRLGQHYSASLVSADGLVYFLSDKGIMTVVKPGQELDIVARNELGENTYASPAISNGQLFIRADKNLYCIGTGKN